MIKHKFQDYCFTSCKSSASLHWITTKTKDGKHNKHSLVETVNRSEHALHDDIVYWYWQQPTGNEALLETSAENLAWPYDNHNPFCSIYQTLDQLPIERHNSEQLQFLTSKMLSKWNLSEMLWTDRIKDKLNRLIKLFPMWQSPNEFSDFPDYSITLNWL